MIYTLDSSGRCITDYPHYHSLTLGLYGQLAMWIRKKCLVPEDWYLSRSGESNWCEAGCKITQLSEMILAVFCEGCFSCEQHFLGLLT